MTLSQRIGDTVTYRIPLRWANRAFDPTGWTLLFTVKSDPDTQADAAAAFQKTSGGGGITVTGTNASVEVLPEDTNALTAGTYYWDLQATDSGAGEIRTVASGTLALVRDVTRESGVTLDVVTVSPPLLYFSYQSYLAVTDDDPVMTEAEWVAAVGGYFRVSETAPLTPNEGDGWFDPATGVYSIWNGNAWVTVTGAPGPTGAAGAAGTPASTTITNSTAATGSTITTLADVDETIYLVSSTASPVAAITLSLPASADSVSGQVKVFISSKTITSLSVSVSGGGTIAGTTLTAAVANDSYAFQCLTPGAWIRLS